MAKIKEFLQKILSARYGKDVRQAIHDAIKQCYEDGKAGSVDLTAREEIGVIEELTTGVKDTIVKAINWLNNSLSTLSNSLVALAKRVSKNETDIGELNSDLDAGENTFIDTPTTTIAEIQTFILNCAKEGKKFIRVHNQNSPNLIFGEAGNFFITINGDKDTVTCVAVNHWNAHAIQFSFAYNTGLGNWQWCNLNSDMPHVQRGREYKNISPSTVTYVDVVFPKPFGYVPTVVVTIFGGIDKDNPHKATVSDTTTTGFRLWMYNAWTGGNSDMWVEWIATDAQ